MKIVFAAFAAAWLAASIVAPASAQGNANPAVRAYVQARAAEELADRNARAAARWPALSRAPGSPSLGNAAAANTIVVFFDYACPYCRAAEPRLLELARRDRNVRVVMKEFPILTPESLVAARMALAAARQNRYWEFHNGVMQMPGQLNVADMEALARSLKLDMARLRRDMQGPQVNDEIIANFNLARGIRAFQTPAYVVNRRVLTQDSGEIDFAREVRGR
jgi:protein-disulfide isomerase